MSLDTWKVEYYPESAARPMLRLLYKVRTMLGGVE